jgi:hypothetical protein
MPEGVLRPSVPSEGVLRPSFKMAEAHPQAFKVAYAGRGSGNAGFTTGGSKKDSKKNRK